MTTAPNTPPSLRRLEGEAGTASTELVVVMPLLLLLVLVSVHIGLWFHARHIVNAAAQEGARAARAAGATDIDGYDRAQQMLDELGSDAIADPTVTVSRNTRTVTVTVTGEATPVIPGLAIAVQASSTSPLEQFA